MGRVLKIVVTGPFNSGKTTFIGSISEIDVVSTERLTRSEGEESDLTTVAMDFGRITLPNGFIIHLYGTPGQERFDFMWEILSEGMLGYVVLIDGSDPGTFGEGKEIIRKFSEMSDRPFVIGLTRGDDKGCVGEVRLLEALSPMDGVEVVKCDARRVKDVKDVLIALLELVVDEAESAERVC